MSGKFRHLAREALAQAKKELASDDDRRLKYVALELRQAFEALTYERIEAFKSEIPPKLLKIWQPRQLINALVELDPSADKSSSLRFGPEGPNGEPPAKMQDLGTEVVLSAKDIKRHYDALGSYVHLPSITQIQVSRESDPSRLKARCNDVIEILEKVLASPIFNVNFGQYATLECFDCKAPIKRKIPPQGAKLKAECFNCDAEYSVSLTDDGRSFWEPLETEVKCPTPECGEAFHLWPKEIKIGTHWTCKSCGVKYQIGLGINSIDGS